MLRLLTLGRLQLVRDGEQATEAVPVQDKRLAVLAYLALGSATGPLRRDTMLGVFWPDLDQADARRALRQSLYHLRNVLGEGVIVGEGDEVALAPDRLWCDAVRMERGAPPPEALELYRGDFLAGFFASGASPVFEEWLEQVRARLRRRAVEAAWSVARDATAAREISAALAAARRAVELAPDDAAGVRRLMSLLEEFGDRAGALASHRELTQRLRTRFDTAPSAETDALAAAIRERRGTSPAPVESGAPPSSRAAAAIEPTPPPPPAIALPPVPVPRTAPRRARWPIVLLLTIAAVTAVVLLRRPSPPTLRDAGRVAATDRLVVEEFEDRAQDPDLAAAVTSLVRVDLTRSSLRVLGSQQVRDALRRMQLDGTPSAEQMRELAVREGARALVRGSVARLGPGYAFTAEVVSPESGEELLALRETAVDSTQLIPAVERLARALRERIGEPLEAVRGRPPLERVTTSSLVALRAYTTAERLKQGGQDRPRELGLLRQAIAADSGFALAWLGLANLYWTTNELDLAREATRRAYQLGERLPPRERLSVEASYHSSVARDERKAAEAYHGMLVRDSTDFRVLNNLALTYQSLHEYDRQVGYAERALRWSDSSYSVVWLGLLQGLVNAGRLDEARATLRAARTRFPDDRFLDWIEAYIAQNDGDLATLDRVGRTLAGVPEHAQEGNRILADLHELRGRNELAAEYRRRAIRIAATDGAHAAVVEDLARLVRVEPREGGSASRQRVFEAEVTRRGIDGLPASTRPFEALELAYLRLGLPDRARALVVEARAAGIEPSPLVARLLEVEDARARGDAPGMAVALRGAQDADECPICQLPDLARAEVAAGRPDSAIAAYRRYLETPYIHRLVADAEQMAPTLDGLARLYRERGMEEPAAGLAERAQSLRR
jgi:DNA-binding SARP family transcriptional activator/tetratricopeptide (TPR) repeat protein